VLDRREGERSGHVSVTRVVDSYWRAAEIRLFAGNKINCVRCCNRHCEITVVEQRKTFRGKVLYRKLGNNTTNKKILFRD
jgi:hypothetical protein